MQLPEQLGRAELTTTDSDVDIPLVILVPETSVLQWEWHGHAASTLLWYLKRGSDFYTPDTLSLSSSTYLLSSFWHTCDVLPIFSSIDD